jgi:hypothetical protein
MVVKTVAVAIKSGKMVVKDSVSIRNSGSKYTWVAVARWYVSKMVVNVAERQWQWQWQ